MTSTTNLEGPHDGEMMSAAVQAEFRAELEHIRATSGLGTRDKLVRTLGALMCVAAAAVVLLSYQAATAADDLRDQLELIVLALFGVGLAIIGSAVYAVCSLQRFLRFWMLRLVYEQRDAVRTPTDS